MSLGVYYTYDFIHVSTIKYAQWTGVWQKKERKKISGAFKKNP